MTSNYENHNFSKFGQNNVKFEIYVISMFNKISEKLVPYAWGAWIQDLVKGGSDKLQPTLSNCYCCLTSPFSTRKSMVKIFAFV